jgi:hypothetical protein
MTLSATTVCGTLAVIVAVTTLAGCASPGPVSTEAVSAGQQPATSTAPSSGPPAVGSSAAGPVSSAGSSGVSDGPATGTAVGGTAAGDNPTAADTTTPIQPASAPVPAAPSVPTLFLTADGGLSDAAPDPSVVTDNSADGQTRDGDPYQPIVFAGSGLTLTYNGGSTSFQLAVDAGEEVGSATQLRISVDLTGDGSWDRVETYRYFATDPVPGAEQYDEAAGILTADGAWGDLANGVVRVEVWAALGNAPSTLELGAGSFVNLPMG